MMNKPELMAPAGDWASLRVAVQAGANSVYLGLLGPSMRNKARNFSYEELKEVVAYCHAHEVRVYVTVNGIVYEWDLEQTNKNLAYFKEIGVDAVICWDVSVIKKALAIGLEVHLSTQASVSNSEAVNFFRDLGVKRVVLARECTLEQIQDIIKKTDVEIECFVHGALCMAISGRCFISQFTDNRSANRGICVQNCRREYTVIDDDGNKLILGNNYILSAEDLCSLPFIEHLIGSGIHCFKIEGRNKGPEYVKRVIEVYRTAIDFYMAHYKEKDFTEHFEKLKMELMNRVGEVYNRGFSSGFFLGKPVDQWTTAHGSKSIKMKVEIGIVENYLSKSGVVVVKIFSHGVQMGDDLLFIGNTTGVVEQKVESMQIDHQTIEKAEKGQLVALKVHEHVRKGDSVHLWINR